MANVFNKTTMLWEVTETGALTAIAPGLNTAWVKKIVMVPHAANDAINFQNASSEDAIYIKAGATDTSPVHLDFGDRGRRVYGLTCQAISTSAKAYVYLM